MRENTRYGRLDATDEETEQLIQQDLKALFQGWISFVIAHRLSTIRTADRILVIEKAKSSKAARTKSC